MAVVFLWVVQHVVIVLTQFFILKVTIAVMTKAKNTLHNCQADYECHLVLTTDRAQLDWVCSSWAQSLFAVGRKSCIVCGLKILILEFKNQLFSQRLF